MLFFFSLLSNILSTGSTSTILLQDLQLHWNGKDIIGSSIHKLSSLLGRSVMVTYGIDSSFFPLFFFSTTVTDWITNCANTWQMNTT